MRLFLISLLTVCWPAWAVLPVADCEPLLAPSASELRLTEAEIHEVQRLYFEQFGISARPGESLLDWLQINPADHSEIVLFSLNNFFGDSLIFHFSMLDFFLTKYPGKKIKIISPKAGVLTRFSHPDVEWLTMPVRFAEYANREDRDHHIQLLRERLPGFIKQNIKPGAFVFFDLTTLDKAGSEVDKHGAHPEKRPSYEFYRGLNEIGATGVGLSNLRDGYIFLGLSGVDVVAPANSVNPLVWTLPESVRLRTLSGRIVGAGLKKPIKFPAENVYQSWLENMSLLFGKDAYLKWDSRYFVNAAEDESLVKDFIRKSGLQPRRPYVLINLNTFGRDKVRELTPILSQTLRSVIAHIIERYPGYDVLAMFPENQFGPEVQEELLDFRQSHAGRLAFIPNSMREIVPAFVNGARKIISYDSGMAHLASFKPKEDVLTVSTQAGQPHLWRRPGQGYIRLEDGADPGELAKGIIQWVDRGLGIAK